MQFVLLSAVYSVSKIFLFKMLLLFYKNNQLKIKNERHQLPTGSVIIWVDKLLQEAANFISVTPL